MSVIAISRTQAVGIMSGPRQVPADVTGRVETMLTEGVPIVDIDRFSEFITGLMVERPSDPNQAVAANYRSILTLGSCSVEMAWQQAGDIRIPRPRRLHEHTQSILNVFDRYLLPDLTDPRDKLLKPMFSLQDGGKTHGVSLALLANPNDPRPNQNQAVHNSRLADNTLDSLPSDVLSVDERTVIKLLIRQTAIGTALRKHQEKGTPLDEVVAEAMGELDLLRTQCPPDYRDRFDTYLIVSFLGDAGGHTQRALYTDAATGEVRSDVTLEDRFNSDGSETMMTLDRLFSEAPEDVHTLRLHELKHRAVMRRLFPNHYE
ncbi:MAG TPA: hypothetical protein VMB52_05285 [Verrucomicrobiae bacterium]|nr:hypothetical protein [Verrucomicrobiae bacterium]